MIKASGNFDFELNKGIMKICIKGEIDHHSAVNIRTDIDSLIYEKAPSVLVLELSEVGFMDSSGLGLIMGRYSLMKKTGGSTVIQNPTPAVMRIIKLAGMERLIKIEKTKTV